MAAELSAASLETVARRSMMMARGTCSLAEYRRMVGEKAAAMAETASVIVRSGGRPSASALLVPWHRRAAGNAKRLRRN